MVACSAVRATVTDVAGISPVEQVCQSWEYISADITSQSPVKKSVIILNLESSGLSRITSIINPNRSFDYLLSPHLAAMSKTQALLEELQNAQLFVAGLHALLINLQSERQLTKTTVTSLLQYPLLDIVNINAVDLAAAEQHNNHLHCCIHSIRQHGNCDKSPSNSSKTNAHA